MEIKLRPWQLSDLENLVKYANNPKIAENLTNAFPHPYTRENGIAFIEMASKANPTTIFAITVDDKAIGGIGLHPQGDIHSINAELGYWLAEPFWGKGIITKAIMEIIPYGFGNFEITRIFARPFGRNIGSQKVLEKTGFTLEAKFEKTLVKNGKLEDELIFGIRKKQAI